MLCPLCERNRLRNFPAVVDHTCLKPHPHRVHFLFLLQLCVWTFSLATVLSVCCASSCVDEGLHSHSNSFDLTSASPLHCKGQMPVLELSAKHFSCVHVRSQAKANEDEILFDYQTFYLQAKNKIFIVYVCVEESFPLIRNFRFAHAPITRQKFFHSVVFQRSLRKLNSNYEVH